jgi:hypothetical protein
MEHDEVHSPFEWDAPLHFTEKVEIAIGCVLLLPVRVIATLLCAGLGALWCQLIYFLFSIFGRDPSKHPPRARRARVLLLRYPCMLVQRIWLFALGFWWIEVTGHDVCCGVWWGNPAKVIVANHTSILDMLIMVTTFAKVPHIIILISFGAYLSLLFPPANTANLTHPFARFGSTIRAF